MSRATANAPTEVDELADSLRFSLARLARLLRQQDQSGMAPALATALASIHRDGPVTLSRLAQLEQVTPPTVTKLVDKLETLGFIERLVDPSDRRVCRVRSTEAGADQLGSIRARRTEWLASRIAELPERDQRRLRDVVDVLDHLVRPPDPDDGGPT